MAVRRKRRKARKPASMAGKTGFIVMHDENYDESNPSWKMSGEDVHSSLKAAQDCCGGAGTEYSVLEVTLVAQHKSTTTFEAVAPQIKFND